LKVQREVLVAVPLNLNALQQLDLRGALGKDHLGIWVARLQTHYWNCSSAMAASADGWAMVHDCEASSLSQAWSSHQL